jgi:curved DNA-binding protein CbpA
VTRSKTYYQVLQVDPSAEPEVIAAAYKRLALKYHPDTNHAPEAKARMQALNAAYAVLSVPAERARYDASLRRTDYAPPPSPAPEPEPPQTRPARPPGKVYSQADTNLGRAFIASFVVIAGVLFFLLRAVARSPGVILAILLIAGIISFMVAFRIDDALHR